MKRSKNSLKEQSKATTKKGYQKTKQVAKKAARITGSHLATLRSSLTLSNNEAELMEELLNKRGVYTSKSEILRAGLWNLKNMKSEELENALKELVKVKKTRVL